MRAIDGDRLKRKAQEVATEAWKMKIKANVEVILNEFIDWINDAPTIEPEPPWIPCQDRLPDRNDEYFVSVDPRYIPPGCRSTDRFIWQDGKWVIADYFVLDGEGRKKPEYKVIEVDIPVLAWMPLPKEYQEDEINAKLD